MVRQGTRAPGLFAILLSVCLPWAHADLVPLTDVNPSQNVFECDLTAVEKDVTIGGATVHAFTYKDEWAPVVPASAGIPIPVMTVKVGDTIICRFKNALSTESASIHWHGIELDNDSDGTAVTQDAVLPGQSYTYRFQTFRPGIYWFHPHMLPGNTLFGGTYGVIIIENNIESSLKGTILPAEADTFTLAMSDIEFDPITGQVGKLFKGAVKTENELIELCHLHEMGEPGGDPDACDASALPGSIVLVNGEKPEAAALSPKFVVPSGKRIRLQLLNESISRHFRLKLLNSGNNNLYRIGGQGGLLDNVILEGGTKGAFDTKFNSGEIVLAAGVRADVIIVPSGNEGDIIQLVGNPLPLPFKLSSALPPDYPIAYFQISGTASDTPPTPGDPILAGTAEMIEDLKSGVVTTPLVDPAPFSGSSDETIHLTASPPPGYEDTTPGIDFFASMLDSNAGNGDFFSVPRPPNARYAHVGDVLELAVRNDTPEVHPFHLHGFSMQPVRIVDVLSGSTLYSFDYNEFVDTFDVYPRQSYVFRVRLDDRPKFCDLSPDFPANPGPVLAECAEAQSKGAIGRWLFHCHILNHGTLGMMSELTVLANPVANSDSLVRQRNGPGKIALAELLGNDTAPAGNTISLTGVESPTANGATVTLDTGWLIYQPPLGFNASDSFIYHIRDTQGGTAAGTVLVSVAADTGEQTRNIISVTASGPDVILRVAGIAGRSYRIETTGSLTTPITWTPHPAGPQTAAPNGVVQLTDPAPPTPRYYRAVEN